MTMEQSETICTWESSSDGKTHTLYSPVYDGHSHKEGVIRRLPGGIWTAHYKGDLLSYSCSSEFSAKLMVARARAKAKGALVLK
jgi:hypothetical protein